jgi:hypothetical protein
MRGLWSGAHNHSMRAVDVLSAETSAKDLLLGHLGGAGCCNLNSLRTTSTTAELCYVFPEARALLQTVHWTIPTLRKTRAKARTTEGFRRRHHYLIVIINYICDYGANFKTPTSSIKGNSVSFRLYVSSGLRPPHLRRHCTCRTVFEMLLSMRSNFWVSCLPKSLQYPSCIIHFVSEWGIVSSINNHQMSPNRSQYRD